jgi:hypothetical protein
LIELIQERVACGRFAKRSAHFSEIQMTARSPNGKKQLREEARGGLKGTRRQRITKLLIDIEKRLDLKNSKVTLADFIRLTQLERELEEEEQPREIIVTWKDPAEKRCGLK